MNFDWSEESKQSRKQILAWLAQEEPSIAELEIAELAGRKPLLLRGQEHLATNGYGWPGARQQGDPSSPREIAADLEVATASASLFLGLQASWLLAELCRRFGVAAARGAHGPGAVSSIGAVAHHDSLVGADAAPTTAEQVDGGWRFSGRKPFVTNGPLADWIAVFAGTESGVVVGLVRPDQTGVLLQPAVSMLGLGGTAVCGLDLDGVVVAEEFVLGPFARDEAGVWLVGRRDLTLALAAVGLMMRALKAASDYAAQPGRKGKPIRARQEVSFKLAEMLTLTQTAELLCCRAAWMLGEGNPEAGTVVRCAKVFCAENGVRTVGDGLEIMAARGCLAGEELERAFRDAKTLSVMGTGAEVARTEIADALLESY